MLGFARLVPLLAWSSLTLFAQDTQFKGVHPRATPDDYAVQASGKGVTFAASLIPADQAKSLFAFDISSKYLVFEVAYFPHENQSSEILLDDFVLKRGDKGDVTRGSEAAAVAAEIQKENSPRRSSTGLGSDTQVHTEAHIGYESGRDPVTGQRVNGTYAGGGVGVEHGAPNPPDYPRPGGSVLDRELLERQLQDRQLPAGKFDHAIAGYLYFPRAAVKKDAAGNYVLEHLGETNSTGVSETIKLAIPTKNR